MLLSSYISFAGSRADVVAYYRKTLGAELLCKVNFGEMSKSTQDSEDDRPSGLKLPVTTIARANLCVTGSDIMMSDSALGGNAHYSGFTLVLDAQDVDEGKRWFDSLTANRKIEMDWQETFQAHSFGKVSDQYGVPWMINIVKQQQPPTE